MKTFRELGLGAELCKAVEDLGFVEPTAVQQEVIPALLQQDRDILALAQTGTGKTAAFGLPILQQIDIAQNKPQALILSPTRELCLQICRDLESYAGHLRDIRIIAVYGGSSIDQQIRALKQGVHIIVATPGRLVDLIQRKVARLDTIRKVVLDEADEMLQMGFTESLQAILSVVPPERNTLLFSATMPPAIALIAGEHMNNPLEVTIGKKNLSSAQITHEAVLVRVSEKYAALKQLLDYHADFYGIIFCRTRRDTQELADKLVKDGYRSDSLHGDLSQAQRDHVMNKFRKKHLQVLIATDVAARGIDVEDLTHVVHFHLPDEAEVYNHRSGRTGRAGKTGTSVIICTQGDRHILRRIEQKIGQQIGLASLPSRKEVLVKRMMRFVSDLEKAELPAIVEPDMLNQLYGRLEGLTKEQLIQHVIAQEFAGLFAYYEQQNDVFVQPSTGAGDRRSAKGAGLPSRDRNSRGVGAQDFQELSINLGHKHGFTPGSLIELINQVTPGQRIGIGRINVRGEQTFFEVPKQDIDGLEKVLRQVNYRRQKVRVSRAGGYQSPEPVSKGGRSTRALRRELVRY